MSLTDPFRIAGRQGPALLREVARTASLWRRANGHLRAGRPQQALDTFTTLVTELGPARESMTTYRRIDALLRDAAIDAPVPQAGLPERLVMFIGYSRSGHSLVGSLLDAHPHVALSHELHALKHLARGTPFAEVCRAIALNAWLFERAGRRYTGYDYRVPGQHQGRADPLRLAGDKKGNGTLRLLRRRPELLERLDELAPVPLSLVHVIRNPFDNIATRARRKGVSLDHAASGYLANAAVVARLQARYGDRVIDVYLDDLIATPQLTLQRLLERLGLTAPPTDYLDACARLVFDRPSLTRRAAHWTPSTVRNIVDGMEQHGFLHRFLDAERPQASHG